VVCGLQGSRPPSMILIGVRWHRARQCGSDTEVCSGGGGVPQGRLGVLLGILDRVRRGMGVPMDAFSPRAGGLVASAVGPHQGTCCPDPEGPLPPHTPTSSSGWPWESRRASFWPAHQLARFALVECEDHPLPTVGVGQAHANWIVRVFLEPDGTAPGRRWVRWARPLLGRF